MAARFFKEKKIKNKQTKSCLFQRYFFMFTITLITEKVLGDEFRWKKTIQVKMSGSEKIKAKHIGQLLHKNNE